MDILPADRYKKLLRFALWFIRQKVGKTADEINNDVSHCGNPVIRKMMKHVNNCLDKINEEPQRNRTKEVANFFAWIMYKDTAYRQPFFYILNEIINDKDCYKEIKDYVEQPDKWYVNQWHESKKITAKKRNENKLTDKQLSDAELIYVPQVQDKKFDALYKEMETKRKRWW